MRFSFLLTMGDPDILCCSCLHRKPTGHVADWCAIRDVLLWNGYTVCKKYKRG